MSPVPPRADMPDVAADGAAGCGAAGGLSREVRSAFNWLRTQEPQLAQWHADGDGADSRASVWGVGAGGAWLAERFREVGLDDVRIDDVGNVFGVHPGFGQRYVALSAHIDTVFPANTPLNIRQQGSRLVWADVVSDNWCRRGGGDAGDCLAAAGGAAAGTRCRSCLSATCGEEGEGDFCAPGCGIIFSKRRAEGDSIAYSVVLDGAGGGIRLWLRRWGSRRFEVIVRGPGGQHSWSDFGAPNPIVILARAVDTFSTTTPVPAAPKTCTFNIGVIRARGTSW